MRSIFLAVCALAVFCCAGCGTSRKEAAPAPGDKRTRFDAAPAEVAKSMEMAKKAEHDEAFVAQQDQPAQPAKDGKPQEKKEKPRKIRYSADIRLIVDKFDDAEEGLDAARKEAKGEYEKVEVNSSAGTVRSGMWRVRVPVENLNSFRKAVKKLGAVERDTIESDDMTAKYYDLEAHLVNRKAEQLATREFLVEIGKKDPRYLDVKRELDAISDDINRKEGQLKLWANLTDLTTCTIHMTEKQPYIAAPKVEPVEVPTFGMRASSTWKSSWDAFVGFLEVIVLIAIAVTPWLPIPLLFFAGLWLIARRLLRAKAEPVIMLVEAEGKKG